MSKLVISNDIVIRNNGIDGSKTNKCGTISIAQGSATDIDFINDFLQIGNHEQLDFNKFKNKLQELSNLLGFKIFVHGAKNFDIGLTRIWLNNLHEITPIGNFVNYQIHILWYGMHFEYVKWDKIQNYPDFDSEIFEIVKSFSNVPEEILLNYNLNISI